MMVRHVVCGMELDPEDAPVSLIHEGINYYFCSDACQHEFEAEPEKYIGFEGVV
ncbi:MAG: YHS domain-containing protein [Dehalococcoidia bacterium]|nr:MAG: YHS domain-containing protein [Dehalococcoidia bacterium]